jgi:hypothetical protein
LIEPRAGQQRFSMPAKEIIDHYDGMARREQLLHGVRTDVSGPAGDENVHGLVCASECGYLDQ